MSVKTNQPMKLLINEQAAPLREAYNVIRMNLLARFAELGLNTPVVGVSAVGAEDDHRALALNLAVSFARLGKRVLLVDADYRGEGMAPLLADAQGEGTLREAVEEKKLATLATAEEGLRFLPCGLPSENPADFVGGAAFTEALAALRTQYDVVFVNLPDAYAFADAATAAPALSGVVLAARLGRDNRRHLAAATERFRAVSVPLLGVVALEK